MGLLDWLAEVDVNVQIGESPSKCTLVPKLRSNDNLSNIRKILKEKTVMDDTLLFARNENNMFVEILKGDEVNITLNEIISDKFLYLTKSLEPDWRFLNKKHKLDFGRIVALDEFKIAKQRAFELKSCEMEKFGVNGYQVGHIKYSSSEDKMVKTNLFLTADADVQGFVKLGVSFGRSKNEKAKLEINSTCEFIEHNKISLELNKLEPTTKFKEEVEKAIESKNPKRFREITEKFGQFISTEVNLGGRAYFKESKNFEENSKENSNKAAMSAGAGTSKIKVENTSTYSKENSNNFEHGYFKLLGGEPNCAKKFKEFNEEAWAQSLNDFRYWDCVKYKNPISIFQLLPDDLCERIYLSVGKKILYSKTEDFDFISGKPGIFELRNIPQYISKLLQDKKAKCNIFATFIDTEETKKVILNWRIQYPSDENEHPRIIIHCIKGPKKHKYKLKVNWMIIGYDINFNFILSDLNIQLEVLEDQFEALTSIPSKDNKKILDFKHDSDILCFGIPVLNKFSFSNNSLVIGHHFFKVREAQEKNKIGRYTFSYSLNDNNYVNLPSFTFYTLIISNFPTSNAYGTLPFKCNNKVEKLLNSALKQHNSLKATELNSLKSNCTPLMPKYISLFSTGENNCGPILLKQKLKEIKAKHFKSCEKEDCICRKNDLECVFFDPNQGNIVKELNYNGIHV
ncbi:unnamed protein product [Rhizophagus irregularis]|uniref:MACPF domain-containing protein n=1 Tax=Rhizophagus irregularis TaxID=588596 RepID=A0A2I1EFC5_9GLOM|nr:hypothetical protein RhiirB3_385192 [Rhizophagus irregularis]CAB5378398.1 unnamed protein product [Rhizophagus irregularis]